MWVEIGQPSGLVSFISTNTICINLKTGKENFGSGCRTRTVASTPGGAAYFFD